MGPCHYKQERQQLPFQNITYVNNLFSKSESRVVGISVKIKRIKRRNITQVAFLSFGQKVNGVNDVNDVNDINDVDGKSKIA